MNLEMYDYEPSESEKDRRKCLKKAIQDSSFDDVFEELRHILLTSGRKAIYQDLVFLEKRKNRYYTEKSSYEVPEKEVLQ